MSNYDYIILSGGYDPLHSGHLAMIRDAVARSNHGVIILLNSDDWLTRKKGKPFMNAAERADILQDIRGVARVFGFNDDDGTATDGIKFVAKSFPICTLHVQHLVLTRLCDHHRCQMQVCK